MNTKFLGEMLLENFNPQLLSGPVQCTVTKDLEKKEFRWLKRDFKKGEQLFLWRGLTHGCIGPDGIAVCLVDEQTPFFELPKVALEIHWPAKE